MRDDRADLKNVIHDFIAERPALFNAKAAHDSGTTPAEELLILLADNGIEARPARFSGWKHGKRNAHSAWRDAATEEWAQHAAVVGNLVVDVTPHQFDQTADHPLVVPLDVYMETWEEAHVLKDLASKEILAPLEAVFHPEIHMEHGQLYYDDGFVHGSVDVFDMGDDGQGIVIHEWSSHDPRRGNTVKAIEWLRQTYSTIVANGVGTVEEVNGELVGDIATQYWQHMRSKGLVDALIDDDGFELDPDNRRIAPGESPAP